MGSLARATGYLESGADDLGSFAHALQAEMSPGLTRLLLEAFSIILDFHLQSRSGTIQPYPYGFGLGMFYRVLNSFLPDAIKALFDSCRQTLDAFRQVAGPLETFPPGKPPGIFTGRT